jgi:hypothetical protein
MDEQQARRALAESFRRERSEREAKERAHPTRALPHWLQRLRDRIPVLIGFLIFVLVAGVPAALVVGHIADSVGIRDEVTQFCRAAGSRDYAGAYYYLSSGAQRRLPSDAFATAAGKLVSCDLAKSAIWANVQGDTARMDVVFQLDEGGDQSTPVTHTVILVRQGGSWHLDAVDTSDLQFLPAANA